MKLIMSENRTIQVYKCSFVEFLYTCATALWLIIFHLSITITVSFKFIKFSIMDSREFEWESQLRFYWQQQPDELMVMQCTGEFGYGYEYMGLNGRLVITPLTDRIYLTITQVLFVLHVFLQS